jgi:hypothetical protein
MPDPIAVEMLTITPDALFWETHIYHVVLPGEDVPLGVFMTLDCAARTCVLGPRVEYLDSYVVNTVTGDVYKLRECREYLMLTGLW